MGDTFEVVEEIGFREKWCSWIQTCISTVQFFVLVNGTPTDFFGSSRGLRQVDPLSPLLFLVMIKVFSRIVKRMEGADSTCSTAATLFFRL